MDIANIANIIEPHKIAPEKLQELESGLLEQLKTLASNAHEDRGVLYYFLLRVRLNKNTLLEDQTIKKYLDEMFKNFDKHEEETWKNFRNQKDQNTKKIIGFQLKAFYKIMESYLLHLEREFEKKDFNERLRDTYQKKMKTREKYFLRVKKYTKWFLYIIWRKTSKYGESFAHWGYTNLITVVGYAIVFYFVGNYLTVPTNAMISENGILLPGGFFNYLYYSIVTFTTLGYGDIAPISFIEKIIASMEVIQGYVMLGVFLTLLQKRL